MSITATRETIAPFIQELERMAKTKADYVVAEADLTACLDGEGQPRVFVPGPMNSLVAYEATPHAVNQIHDRLGIPREYGRKLYAEKPQLWADNVNGWGRDSKKNVLARTLDGHIRGVMSDKYRVLDSYDLFLSAYQTIKEVGADITSASVTDWGNRFYLRAVVPGWREVVKPVTGAHQFIGREATLADDAYYPGVILTNSETGQGGLNVSPFLYRLRCLNGLIADDVVRKIHLGERQSLGYLSDEARTADASATWLHIRDLIRNTFDRDAFKALVADLSDTTETKLPSPTKAVDNVVANFGLSEADRQGILDELISPTTDIDPGRTVYGMIQAVTNRAKAYADDPDKVTEFERIGGSILREPALVLAKPKK